MECFNCVCLCVYRSKCSLTDRYRLHLSAADLMFVLVLPFWAVDAALAEWIFGYVTCVCVHVIYTMNLYCSVLILAFISLDRYLAVVRATCTRTSGLRQLMANKLIYVGECLSVSLWVSLSINLFCNFLYSTLMQLNLTHITHVSVTQSPAYIIISHLFHPPTRCLVASWTAGSTRHDICSDPDSGGWHNCVPAHIPWK